MNAGHFVKRGQLLVSQFPHRDTHSHCFKGKQNAFPSSHACFFFKYGSVIFQWKDGAIFLQCVLFDSLGTSPRLLASNFLIPLPMSQSSQTACLLIFICMMSRSDELLWDLSLSLMWHVNNTLLLQISYLPDTKWKTSRSNAVGLNRTHQRHILDLMCWLCYFICWGNCSK